MISGTYLGSAAVVVVLALLLRDGSLTTWSFMGLVMAAFFLASAGASSAYLTVSEIFPMETRALAIALFYAIGTAVGGITGPLLFGHFIHSGKASHVATGFLIGAAAMALGGVAELCFGVRAEQRSLEDIATPLTAEVAEAEPGAPRVAPATPEEHKRAERVQSRADRRQTRETAGARRYRPGPGGSFYSPAMQGIAGTPNRSAAMAEYDLDREIEMLLRALEGAGAIDRDALASRVGSAGWGPGRFQAALREAVDEGRVSREGRDSYSASDSGGNARVSPR
jgi:MFS family permease